MAATVRGAIRELLEETMTTIDALLEAPDGESCDALVARLYAEQGDLVPDHQQRRPREDPRVRSSKGATSAGPASPMDRLIAGWLTERAGHRLALA